MIKNLEIIINICVVFWDKATVLSVLLAINVSTERLK